MRPQSACLADMPPAEMVSQLALLISEARLPAPESPKGRVEGPHCPQSTPTGIRPSRVHACDMTNAQCSQAMELANETRRLWARRIPLVLEVRLQPKSCLSSVHCRACCIVLERWSLSFLPKRRQSSRDKPLMTPFLLQAIRSFLHFSQLSAWLASAQGHLSNRVAYRLSIPGEADCLATPPKEYTPAGSHLLPDAPRDAGVLLKDATGSSVTMDCHAFPPCIISEELLVSVRVESLGRISGPPGPLICPCLEPSTSAKWPPSSATSLDFQPTSGSHHTAIAEQTSQSVDNPAAHDDSADSEDEGEIIAELEISPPYGRGPMSLDGSGAGASALPPPTSRPDGLQATNRVFGIQGSLTTERSLRERLEALQEQVSRLSIKLRRFSHADESSSSPVQSSSGSPARDALSRAGSIQVNNDASTGRLMTASARRRADGSHYNPVDARYQYGTPDTRYWTNVPVCDIQKDSPEHACGPNCHITEAVVTGASFPSPSQPIMISKPIVETPAPTEAVGAVLMAPSSPSCSFYVGGAPPGSEDTSGTASDESSSLAFTSTRSSFSDFFDPDVKRRNLSADINGAATDATTVEELLFDDVNGQASTLGWNLNDVALVDCGESETAVTKNVPHARRIAPSPGESQCSTACKSRPQEVVSTPPLCDRRVTRLNLGQHSSSGRRNGVMISSSPAPLKRNQHSFAFDSTLVTPSAIKLALYNDHESGSSDSECGAPLCKSAPASTNLLHNFEESALTGRLKPFGRLEGFTAELAASGAFCPPHYTIPVSAFFFHVSDDNAPSPYLGHCGLEFLGKKGYRLPKKGTVQVTLFNPQGTVVKMFVVCFDLHDMPPSSQTFVRQRTFLMPSGANSEDAQAHRSWLRYLIHLRFATSRSGKLCLHTDIRMLFSRKVELETDTENFELRSFTQMPKQPKYSPRKTGRPEPAPKEFKI